MATNAGISRSGRVRKKSAKLIEMEDWDATDPEAFGKVKKKLLKSPTDESDGDKKVAPIKIPKLSLGLSSPPKKKEIGGTHSVIKVPFPNTQHGRSMLSIEGKTHISEAQSMSSSPESSDSSSSDDSDMEHLHKATEVLATESKKKSLEEQDLIRGHHSSRSELFKQKPTMRYVTNSKMLSRLPTEPKQKIQSLLRQAQQTVMCTPRQKLLPANDVSSEPAGSFDDSEEDTNEPPLIIAETVKKPTLPKKPKRESKPKLKKPKKPKPYEDMSDLSPSTTPEKKMKKRKPPEKGGKAKPKKKDKSKSSRPMSAYMLWCQENRKRIVAQSPVMDFVSISKKLGEAWQSLPDKEKMIWRNKAKSSDSDKDSPLVNTSNLFDQSSKHSSHSSPLKMSDDSSKGGSLDGFRTVGTSPIDVAAHLKLLGESLSIIGQRLTEHEGQIAVSGSLSVLLDSTLCALAPLLCLTSQVKELDGCSQENLCHILDNVAYFMPGL